MRLYRGGQNARLQQSTFSQAEKMSVYENESEKTKKKKNPWTSPSSPSTRRRISRSPNPQLRQPGPWLHSPDPLHYSPDPRCAGGTEPCAGWWRACVTSPSDLRAMSEKGGSPHADPTFWIHRQGMDPAGVAFGSVGPSTPYSTFRSTVGRAPVSAR